MSSISSYKGTVQVATVLSGAALIGIVGFLGLMVNDISTFHDDAMTDLGEFKMISNSAWTDMVAVNRPSSADVKAIFAGRGKRSAGSCGCAAGPNTCPPGPPGTPGLPGSPGDDGEAGEAGKDGKSGLAVLAETLTAGQGNGYESAAPCTSCPAGPPGAPGVDGEAGEPGKDGEDGKDGPAGKDGENGAQGEQGEKGEDGKNGSDGKPGAAGKNGKRGAGAPGAPGKDGKIGRTGKAGPRGERGEKGADGPQGPAGAPGHNGPAGLDGASGEAGGEGLPGADAAYCPCPARSFEVKSEPASQGYRRRARESLFLVFYFLMRVPHKFWNALVISIICITIYFLLTSSFSQTRAAYIHDPVRIENVEAKIQITIIGQDDGSRRNKTTEKKEKSSMSCNIPKLEINGSDVIKFFKEPRRINCLAGNNWVYIDADGKVQLVEERKSAKCKAQPIIFESDSRNTLGQQVDLEVGKELPSEMVNVKCSHGTKTWEFPLISLQKVKKESKESEKKRWSVLMLSFDSVSQMTFRRKLPKTVKFLEEELGTIVMNGYNIVGDGTPQAFIPILTGATEEELPLTRKRFKESSFVDDVYPFIWKNYSDAGYVTLFAEDQAYLGMMNYRLKGFRHPPTDHYTRPYFKHLEGRTGNTNAQCVGSDVQHKHWLRYAREFAETYQDMPRFGLMHHCVYSHDDINLVGHIDNDFSAFLRSMSEDGLLDDTILIVMADHGHRFAKLRETHQGQLEERLPFYSFTLPKELRDTEEGEKMYQNLKVNKDRLSSPFDIHQTLHDILELPEDLTTEQSVSSRSLSLLRPIPSSRNCDQAGIAPHWCTCLDWKNAMVTKEDKLLSTQIADAIVQAFNEQLKNEIKSCAPLKLKGIEYAKKLIPKEDLLKYKTAKDQDGFKPNLSGKTKATHAHYQIKLLTTPGRGVYEVTVLFDFSTRHLTLDLSSVSHVSRYGDDPHCIIDRNYFLATYCVCYDKI